MTPGDRYQALTNSPLGSITSRIGLPTPPMLERHRPGMPVARGPVALGGAHGGRLEEAAARVLRSLEAVLLHGDGRSHRHRRRVAFQRLNEAALVLEDQLVVR